MQKLHLPKISSEHLFEVETEPPKLYVFSISKNKLKTYQPGFVPYWGMCLQHVGNSIYLGGGEINGENYSNFRKVLTNGEGTELQRMLTPKSGSAMTLWKERDTIFTVGGWNGSHLK